MYRKVTNDIKNILYLFSILNLNNKYYNIIHMWTDITLQKLNENPSRRLYLKGGQKWSLTVFVKQLGYIDQSGANHPRTG